MRLGLDRERHSQKMQLISAQQIEAVLDWEGVLQALHDAHLGQRPLGNSYLIGDADYRLFSRGVILPGRGAGLKLASIHPANATATPRCQQSRRPSW